MDALEPAALRPHYRRFVAPGRILLSGHSHQAWPDVAREGLLEAFDDAALHVDDKWSRALAKGERLREAIAERIGGRPGDVALGQNTHELVCRFLSALDLARRPRLVTTTGEFHTLDRQLRRLAEAGLEVERVPAMPVETLAERVAARVDTRTAAVLVSTVLFETAARVPHLTAITEAAHRYGAAVLFDAYHGYQVAPTRLEELGPDPVFLTAGGYKYAQWGEGCCFLRIPGRSPKTTGESGAAADYRPVFTGWFADFAHLEGARDDGPVAYADRNAERFAGATYDPASHYRAARVADFFDAEGMTVERLRALSLRQTGRLIEGLDGFDVVTPRDDAARAGFVSIRLADPGAVVRPLRERGVYCDARGSIVRLGPAPYVTDDEIDQALAHLRAIATEIGR
jgi:selenocysteine lyase/cysteine desulfurase